MSRCIVSKNRVAHDLTGVIDSVCGHLNTSSPQGPQVLHTAFLGPQECGVPRLSARKSHNCPRIVYAQGKAFNTPGKRSEVPDALGRGPKESVRLAVCVGVTRDPTVVVDRSGDGFISAGDHPQIRHGIRLRPRQRNENQSHRCPHTKPDPAHVESSVKPIRTT